MARRDATLLVTLKCKINKGGTQPSLSWQVVNGWSCQTGWKLSRWWDLSLLRYRKCTNKPFKALANQVTNLSKHLHTYLNDLGTYEPRYKRISHTYRQVKPSVQPSEPLDYHLNLENIHTASPKASSNVHNHKIHSLLAPIHPSQLTRHSHSLGTAMATILWISRTFTCVYTASNSTESHCCPFSFWTVLFDS